MVIFMVIFVMISGKKSTSFSILYIPFNLCSRWPENKVLIHHCINFILRHIVLNNATGTVTYHMQSQPQLRH